MKDKTQETEKQSLHELNFREARKLTEELKSSTEETYQDLLDEVAYYQYQMRKVDQKTLKKNKKLVKQMKTAQFMTSREQIRVRKEIIQEAGKQGGLFDRLIKYLKQISPFVKYLGQICARFICTILKFDVIKRRISRQMLEKIDLVYQVCINL